MKKTELRLNKRKAVAVIILLPLLFCAFFGCAKSERTPAVPQKLSLNAKIDFDDNTMSISMERTSIGTWSVGVTSPEQLCGLTFDYSQNGVTVSFMGLTRSLDSSGLPESSVIEQAVRGVDEASAEGAVSYVRSDENGKGSVYSGCGGFGDYTICINEKGIPVWIDFSGGMRAEFTEKAS